MDPGGQQQDEQGPGVLDQEPFQIINLFSWITIATFIRRSHCPKPDGRSPISQDGGLNYRQPSLRAPGVYAGIVDDKLHRQGTLTCPSRCLRVRSKHSSTTAAVMGLALERPSYEQALLDCSGKLGRFL